MQEKGERKNNCKRIEIRGNLTLCEGGGATDICGKRNANTIQVFERGKENLRGGGM
jgi:hypothetical protein